MTTTDQVSEIRAFYEKQRSKLIRENERQLGQLARAEAATLKCFQAKPATVPSGNGTKTPRVRGSRLDPEIQKAVLAVLTQGIGYTVKEIARMSKASKSQVRAAIDQGEKAGLVAGDLSKRNRKYVLAKEASANV